MAGYGVWVVCCGFLQAQKAAGEEIVGCDRVRLMLNGRALDRPRVLGKLRLQRDVCSKGSYFSDAVRECVDCRPCNSAASAVAGGGSFWLQLRRYSLLYAAAQCAKLTHWVSFIFCSCRRPVRPESTAAAAGRGAKGRAFRAPKGSTLWMDSAACRARRQGSCALAG